MAQRGKHSVVSKRGRHSRGSASGAEQAQGARTRAQAQSAPSAPAREHARGRHSAATAAAPVHGAAAAPAMSGSTAGASAPGLPGTREIRTELERTEHNKRFFTAFRSTVFILVVAAAAAALTAVMLLPVLRIYGDSMSGTLDTGDVVVSVKTSDFHTGDVMAFYYNNNVLVKRVIAQSGDWVNIDQSGNVFVNGQQIDEPYLSSKAYGETNIALPYQVPDGKVFVMGDNRAVSIDSRNTAVGCISSEQIVGRIVFRVWPLAHLGPVS